MRKKLLHKGLTILLVFIAVFMSACGTPTQSPVSDAVSSDENLSADNTPKNAVTILYTNDVHAYIDNDSDKENPGISYAELAQMKKDLGENVLLVDAGDHIQGAVYGAMDQGQSVLEIMDGIYDLSAVGNHEFDYGIERMLSITANSKYPYISCNFVHKETEKTVLEPHIMMTVGNVKVGFVGITTPETLTSTAPSYFQNDKGEFIYDFLDGDKLYAAVQSSVDKLKAEGADCIIALGHVGVDGLSKMTSRKIIENVSGLNAFIDGHSHTEIQKETVTDKSGASVVLTQTGNYFSGIGKMTITEDGIETEIIKEYNGKDNATLTLKNEWVDDVSEMLGEKIGNLGAKLTINDAEGNRLVRVAGTNLGEFVADSYYYYVNFVAGIDCDVAIINGGGVRDNIEAGKVSYMDLKSVNPFGNMLCAVELTGAQILDALEWGARLTTGEAAKNEEGSFLHTAGLIYTVDSSVASTVRSDEQAIWVGAPTGEYRVRDVKIYDKEAKAYVDIDLEKTYCVAGANYTLTDCGGGFAMITGKVVKDYIVEDYMALAAYAIAFEDTDGDDLSDITTQNSPLRAYEGYGMNYEAPLGEQRVKVK